MKEKIKRFFKKNKISIKKTSRSTKYYQDSLDGMQFIFEIGTMKDLDKERNVTPSYKHIDIIIFGWNIEILTELFKNLHPYTTRSFGFEFYLVRNDYDSFYDWYIGLDEFGEEDYHFMPIPYFQLCYGRHNWKDKGSLDIVKYHYKHTEIKVIPKFLAYIYYRLFLIKKNDD